MILSPSLERFLSHTKTASQAAAKAGKDNFPVGTIMAFVGNKADIPAGWAVCDGTNDTPNLSGRFLEGTTGTPKNFRAAGLPNITGKTTGSLTHNGSLPNVSQAFSYTKFHESYLSGNTLNPNGGYYDMTFDASHSNPIYGNSETVQPKSYTVLWIIKVG